jgi:glycine betaine/choline ABC-type transport system substrate-binding protein
VRKAIIATYGSALVRVANAVTTQLTTRDLIGMNQRVEVGGADPATVAADWLRGHPVNR